MSDQLRGEAALALLGHAGAAQDAGSFTDEDLLKLTQARSLRSFYDSRFCMGLSRQGSRYLLSQYAEALFRREGWHSRPPPSERRQACLQTPVHTRRGPLGPTWVQARLVHHVRCLWSETLGTCVPPRPRAPPAECRNVGVQGSNARWVLEPFNIQF